MRTLRRVVQVRRASVSISVPVLVSGSRIYRRDTRADAVPWRISFSTSHWRVPTIACPNRTSLPSFSGSSSHGKYPSSVSSPRLNAAR